MLSFELCFSIILMCAQCAVCTADDVRFIDNCHCHNEHIDAMHRQERLMPQQSCAHGDHLIVEAQHGYQTADAKSVETLLTRRALHSHLH